MSDPTEDLGKNSARITPARIAVWILMLVLIVLAGIEAMANRYNNVVTEVTQKFSEDKLEENEDGVLFADVQSVIGREPTTVDTSNTSRKVYHYSWFSVFRNGQFKLAVVTTADSPEMLIRYYTGDEDPEAEVEVPSNRNTLPGMPIQGMPSAANEGSRGNRPSPESPAEESRSSDSDSTETAEPDNADDAGSGTQIPSE